MAGVAVAVGDGVPVGEWVGVFVSVAVGTGEEVETGILLAVAGSDGNKVVLGGSFTGWEVQLVRIRSISSAETNKRPGKVLAGLSGIGSLLNILIANSFSNRLPGQYRVALFQNKAHFFGQVG